MNKNTVKKSLDELPGMKVKHDVYGLGTVKSVDEKAGTILIFFEKKAAELSLSLKSRFKTESGKVIDIPYNYVDRKQRMADADIPLTLFSKDRI